MTKLRNMNTGDKFVMSDIPGVYKKVTHNRARCVFGPRTAHNMEVEVNPEALVFVIPRESRPTLSGGEERPVGIPARTAEPADDGLVSVVLMDDEGGVIHERRISKTGAVACAAVTAVKVMMPGESKASVLSVEESGYSFEEDAIFLEVRPQ